MGPESLLITNKTNLTAPVSPSCRPGPFVGLPLLSDEVWYVVVILVFVIKISGILGNFVVLISTLRVSEIHSNFYYSLGNLAVADIMFLAFSGIIPLGSLFGRYSGFVGKAYCYISGFLEFGPSLCSISLVTFISVERYIAVCHALKGRFFFRKHRMACCLALIWVITFALGIPFAIYTQYRSKASNCNIAATCVIFVPPSVKWLRGYDVFIICFFRFLPVLVNVVLYSSMTYSLNKATDVQKSKGPNTNRQAISMMGLIVVVFVISVVPFQVMQLLLIFNPALLIKLNPYQLSGVLWASRIAAYTNSACNPFIYAIVSSHFRQKVRGSWKRSLTKSISLSTAT